MVTHECGFDSPIFYYNKGILTGFAVAIELAEECETLDELIAKLTEKVRRT